MPETLCFSPPQLETRPVSQAEDQVHNPRTKKILDSNCRCLEMCSSWLEPQGLRSPPHRVLRDALLRGLVRFVQIAQGLSKHY